MSDLLLLRYTDAQDGRLAAMIRPASAVNKLGRIMDSDDPEDTEWLQRPEEDAVVVATNGTVFITDPEDLTLISFWLACAADRLKKIKSQ